MRLRFVGALILAAALSLSQITADAQAGRGGAQASPANAVPRTREGKPDLSGIWQASMSAANYDILPHSASKDGPAGQGIVEGNEIPYRPEALKKKQENYANRRQAGHRSELLPAGRAADHIHALPVSDYSDAGDDHDPVRVRPRDSLHLYEWEPASARGPSIGGWGIRAAAGRGIRWSST